MGTMKVTSLNGVKVYSVSDQKSLPSWLPPSKLRALKKDEDYSRRIELIQDMNFRTASTRIKSTPDNEFIVVSGIYPPQVKVYEVRELSMKFERHLDSEIVDFQVLGNDYSKIAFLCADRSVWLHAKYGSHYQIRIPRMGRDIAYDCWSADLLLAASSPELYRINLEQGRFLAPIATRSPAINVLGRSPIHGLLACGGEDGALECFDLRQKSAIGRIDAVVATGNQDQEVTAIRFEENEGFLVAVGTSAGQVLLYDLRSSLPVHIKDHMYGTPIVDIKWHESISSSKRHIISSDNRVVRIWDPDNGDAMTNLETPAGIINDICVSRGSGLMFMALDSPQIPAYFIPALGPAPKWCSYLESLTEELEEEGQNIVYDDFKFVTKEDLEKLNLSNLIGTNLLHAYMHGFFIDYRLHNKAKAMADPFAYETYRQQRIQEKLEAERAARITIKKKLPKVNKDLAARLLSDSAKDAKSDKANLLEDDRFKAMFIDKAFEVDEDTEEFKQIHPNKSKKKNTLVDEHFNRISDSESDGGDSYDDGGRSMSDGESSSDYDEPEVTKKQKREKTNQKKSGQTCKPRFYEVKDEVHADAFRNKVSLAKEHTLPLEERISLAEKNRSDKFGSLNATRNKQGGSREIRFRSGNVAKDISEKPDKSSIKKRGVQSLGLRNNFNRGRGRGKPNFRRR